MPKHRDAESPLRTEVLPLRVSSREKSRFERVADAYCEGANAPTLEYLLHLATHTMMGRRKNQLWAIMPGPTLVFDSDVVTKYFAQLLESQVALAARWTSIQSRGRPLHVASAIADYFAELATALAGDAQSLPPMPPDLVPVREIAPEPPPDAHKLERISVRMSPLMKNYLYLASEHADLGSVTAFVLKALSDFEAIVGLDEEGVTHAKPTVLPPISVVRLTAHHDHYLHALCAAWSQVPQQIYRSSQFAEHVEVVQGLLGLLVATPRAIQSK